MNTAPHGFLGIAIALLIALAPAPARAQADAPLPEGVRAVWDLGKAWRETTPTRERISINGLWRWQPARDKADAAPAVPAGEWGYFKVPGSWPGITDYMQKDSQTVFAHASWKDQRVSAISTAWYQREIEIPAAWQGRRVALSLEYLNSFATVYVDGKKAGDLRFPAGELDLTAHVRPGQKHVLSLYVVAMPLKGVKLSYADTATAKEVKGTVARRGLCGDAYLVSSASKAELADVRVDTSVRRGELTLSATPTGLASDGQYILRATVSRNGQPIQEVASKPFTAADLKDGRITVTQKWNPDQRWDLNTPGNVFDLQASLVDVRTSAVLDTAWPTRFGFRELWIDGRDFYLNGTRLFLSAVPFDNAQIGAAAANYAAARETLQRLKHIGINLVYTHNYDCTPGAHLSFEEFLRAADDVGMLVALSQPHFAQYDWKTPNADAENGYARDAAFYVRVAQNHPSVVFYSTSHNACGYEQDMNPDMMDGLPVSRDNWSSNNVKMATRAEAIIHRLDPGRIVYHHAGGNIGAMHTVNFYPNMVPIQELSDWFGHWASAGVKPVFLCEFGAPFAWDWTLYRGWYQGKREFGSAAVPWEFCIAEWDAQFLGDRAYALTDMEKANLRWEAGQFRAGKVWHRWDYPTDVGSPRFDDRNQVMAAYLADNWRAFRTWGASGISPWEYAMFWTPRPGVDKKRRDLKVNWDDLQRPGISADYIDRPMERIDVAYDESDWVPTAAGAAILRNNQPVLAYIAGGGEAFTSKGHNFRAGERLEKQLVVINNSRQTLSFQCDWSLGVTPAVTGKKDLTVETGQQARVPLTFDLPSILAPGTYELRATVRFGDGQQQADAFTIHVLPALPRPQANAPVLVFDPRGETAALFEKLGLPFKRVDADARPTAGDTLVIGKHALTPDGPAPDVSRVREGLRVVLFEQSSQALERRLGFRVVEYGLRQVFPRIPDHPALAGLATEHLRDWQGDATNFTPQLTYQSVPMHGPTVRWCDIPVSRVWRCGNRGSVASVLIEKPARGDFRPILDGGFGLQYSPLLEHRDGKGLVVFCQMDVTGRSADDPAAQALATNLMSYVASWKAPPTRRAVYAGEAEGKAHLESIGVAVTAYDGQALTADDVLIVGPGGGRAIVPQAGALSQFLATGGHAVAIGLDRDDAKSLSPVILTQREHVGAVFEAPGIASPFAGVGAADTLIREPRNLRLLTAGPQSLGDGVLGASGNVVFCQLAPWKFDPRGTPNLKWSFRRTSVLLARVLANQGVAGATPLLDRLHTPTTPAKPEKRWLDGLYLDTPEEWDDPYRFFRW